MRKPFEYPWHRLKPYRFYGFARAVMGALLPLIYNFRVVGREHLPQSARGTILVCNHLHSIDPSFLIAATRLRWRFAAKKELFGNRFVAFLFTHGNAFPIDRGSLDRRALAFAASVMQDGRCGLAIFPEGQRSLETGAPGAFKCGAAVLARMTGADILPCAIYHEGKLRFRTKLTVRIGRVIPYAELGFGDVPGKEYNDRACEKIQGAVEELWEKKHSL